MSSSDRTAEPVELRTTSAGDPQFDQIAAMIEHLQAATAPLIDIEAGPNQLALLMTACSMFAGTLLGTLIVAGVASDQDKRRITDSMAKNFRTGIDAGKRRALRLAADEFGGRA